MFIRSNNGSHHQSSSEVNIALVGALGSGKSALTVKYITRRFINEYDPDLEDTYNKHEVVDNQGVLVRIMDTCDKEGKDPERYLKWADGFLVVFSVTDRSGFQTAQRYLEGISQHLRLTTTYDAPLILVGNKADLERYRQVSTEEGKALANLYEATFFETTAAEEYTPVERVFREAIREIIREQERFMPLRHALVYIASSAPSSVTGEERDRESKSAGNLLAVASGSACGVFGLEVRVHLFPQFPGSRRHFSTSLQRTKREDRKEMLASLPRADEGTEGEKHVDIDTIVHGQQDVFPDEHTPNKLINGVRFADIPICHIKATPNNTIIAMTSAAGEINLLRSCGMEGFRNTRKGTNIAAQATAISFSMKAADKGFNDVRVKVQGLGPGRMSAIKGLTMGGLNVVSITDSTPVSWEVTPRPKKQRKL
nr:EOG090X0DZ9 [Lepidurus arcticus]